MSSAALTLPQLTECIPQAALALRGYNVTNLGRSRELLEHPVFGPVVAQSLEEAEEGFAAALGRRPDLLGRVRRQEETTLDVYDEAIALVLGMEQAQLRVLEEFYGLGASRAKLAFGYSLGEIGALMAAGVIDLGAALKVPLTLAADCVALADDVTLGVFFTRGRALDMDEVRRTCLHVNHDGAGVMGVSAYLSPNSVIVLGQGDTLDRFKARLAARTPERVFLRKNEHRWPPLHTPICWERHVPNRAAMLMHTLPGCFTAPHPPVLSLVTGKTSYNDYNAREILHRWVDHPQRLWEAVVATLDAGIETIIHVGPAPNIIPATFHRLAENVETQLKASYGLRAMSNLVRRPWLKALLPAQAPLLRAPLLRHVLLEDWLLDHAPR